MPIDPRTARRRLVSIANFADLTRELNVLESAHAGGTLRHLGNHPPGALLDHLARTMRWSFDGFPTKAPLWGRLLAPMFKGRLLARPFAPGLKLSHKTDSQVWDNTVPFERALADLRAQIKRFDTLGAPSPAARHPFFGPMTLDEWRTYHCRHAELHLSFLTP